MTTGRWDRLPLAPDAHRAAAELDTVLPRPLHTLGVAGARRLADGLRPSGTPTPVHQVRDLIVLGEHGPIPVRRYQARPTAAAGTVVYLHGGGWTLGSLDGVDEICRALASRTDRAVISVDYRLAPEHRYPIPLQDCFAALRWVFEDLGRTAGSHAGVVLAGDSAGGTLALGTSALAACAGTPVAGQVLVYPAITVNEPTPSRIAYADGPLITTEDVEWFWSNYLRGPDDERDGLAVPAARNELGGLPPSLVITAECDPLRDEGESFAERLLSAGVAAEVHRIPGVFHGFFTEVGTFSGTEIAVDLAARWIRHGLTDSD